MRAIHRARTFKLYGRCRKIVLSSLHCSKFSGKYLVFYIILQLIYHRFYHKNYLFLSVVLYKTTTDQNVNTTRRNFILRFAVRAARFRCKSHKIKSFCTKKTGCSIFLLTGLRIYTGEYKAQGPTLCPTEGRALRGPRALYSPV